MNDITWHAFPVCLLLVCLVFEAVYASVRRLHSSRLSLLRFSAWMVRPWGVWAVFNLLVRLQGDKGFNNLLTFPFFANHWREGETVAGAVVRLAHTPTVWGWSAVVAVLTGGLLLIAAAILRQGRPHRPGPTLLAIYIVAVLLPIAVASLPDGFHPKEDKAQSSVKSNWGAHNTVLYAVPLITSKGYFLRHFLEIQPQLRRTIHAYSHPPGGSLSLYWIGKVMGVGGEDIRNPRVVIHYVIGLALFGGLNVFILYFLGSRLFQSTTIGVVSALIWVSMPATLTYTNFAQNTVYGVFFNSALLLTWLCVTSRTRTAYWAVLLGLVFYAMTMLEYSWCLATTIFAVFASIMGVRGRWSRREILVRGILPLAVMTVLLAATLIHYRLDYLAAYKVSAAYVHEWYRFTGPRQWLTALLGGQIDMLLMAGSVVASAIVITPVRWRKAGLRPVRPEVLLLLVLLGVYVIPLLLGPTALKMETARCWNWVLSIPVAFAASTLLAQSHRVWYVCGAITVSTMTATVMRVFLNFGP